MQASEQQQRLAGTLATQLDGVTSRLDQAVSQVAATWEGTLARQAQTSEALNQNLQTTLAAFTDTFGERAQAVLASVDHSHAEFAQAAQQQQAALTPAGRQPA